MGSTMYCRCSREANRDTTPRLPAKLMRNAFFRCPREGMSHEFPRNDSSIAKEIEAVKQKPQRPIKCFVFIMGYL